MGFRSSPARRPGYTRGDVHGRRNLCSAHRRDILTSARMLFPWAEMITRFPTAPPCNGLASTQETRHRVLERFRQRDICRPQVRVARVLTWIAVVVDLSAGGDVVAPSPDLDLLHAMLFRGLCLVQSWSAP